MPTSGLKLPDTINPVLVQRGRDVAISQGWLRKSDRLSQKIDQFIAMSQTEPAHLAAERSGVSVALIQRLTSLGTGQGR